MKLFSYDNFRLQISEEAYLIKPFRDIVRRDKDRFKNKALAELGYIYFMADPRSDYMYLTDINERQEAIKKHEGLPKKWEPDNTVLEGLKIYEELTQTTASLLLNDLRESIEKIRIFLKTIDLDEEDDKGKPKYPLNTVVAALKQIPILIQQFSETEKSIIKELSESGRMKANKSKKLTEDGFENFIKD